MEYNTQRKRLPLPEYGRSVQNMVDHALTIEDRAERQRCANTIVRIMGNMFPHLRDVPDFKHKLWDHLAIMSDFKLDIDYPYEIVKPEEFTKKPEKIDYPQTDIRYRHYGRFIPELVKKSVYIQDEWQRKRLVRLLALQMKKSFLSWNKDSVEDKKITDDLYEYSNGLIDVTPEALNLNERQIFGGGNNNNHRRQNNQRKQNNQRRRY